MALHTRSPRSSMLPRSALLLLLSSSGAHAAVAQEGEPEPEPACAPEQRVLVIDDNPQTSCAALFGTTEDRARFRAWRESYFHVFDTEGPAIDIVHGVSALNPPEPMQAGGLTLLEVRRAHVREACASDEATSSAARSVDGDAAEGSAAEGSAAEGSAAEGSAAEGSAADRAEWLAVFELDESLAGHCGSRTVAVRVDDALGAAGRFLWIGERGVLALHDDRLAWMPADDAPAPQFRMTWRSGFLVTSVSAGGASSSGSKASRSKTSAARSKARARKSPRKKR